MYKKKWPENKILKK